MTWPIALLLAIVFGMATLLGGFIVGMLIMSTVDKVVKFTDAAGRAFR